MHAVMLRSAVVCVVSCVFSAVVCVSWVGGCAIGPAPSGVLIVLVARAASYTIDQGPRPGVLCTATGFAGGGA